MAVNNPRHSRFFWRSAAMFCILDFECKFMEVNTAWEKLLGLSTGQLLAKAYLDFVHPEDHESTKYYFEQLDSGLSSVSFANRFRHHDGSYRHILWSINSAASTDYAYHMVGMDITEREQPMVADEMISVLQEGVVLQYANGTIGACNASAERILQLNAEQMMGWTLIDADWRMIHEDGSPFPAETHPAICTLRTGQAYADVVMGIVKPDDSVVWIRLNAYPLWRDDVTTPYAVVISFSDITAFKETEQSLRKSNSEATGTMVPDQSYELWDWDLSSNEINFAPSWKAMLGYEDYELPNHVESWHQRIHPSDYKRVMADIQNHLDGLTVAFENKHRLQHKDGTYRWIFSRGVVVKNPNGKATRMVGTHVDITEPRRVEEQLEYAEKKYQQLLETETDAIFLVDAETTEIIDVNKAAVHLYGYPRAKLLKKNLLDLSAQPDKLRKAIEKGIKRTAQQYHRQIDDTVFPVELNASAFNWRGREVLLVAVRDISERQRIENALWESESKYRQLFEGASNPIVVFDANTQQFFDVNRAAIDLYGMTKEEFLNLSTDNVSAEPAVKQRSAFSTGSKRVHIPLRWHKKRDGTVFPVEISAGNSYLFQGRSLVCATIRDITERKASEEALRKEKDFINTLVQASPTFFVALEPNGNVRMMNDAMLTALDYTLDDALGQNFLDMLVLDDERNMVATEFEKLRTAMQPMLFESHVIGKNGQTVLAEWHSRAIVKADGTLDYFFGVGIDITERKKAQGHMRLFKSIVESSSESIVITDPEGQLVYVNPAHERLLGYSQKDVKEMKQYEFYPEGEVAVWAQVVAHITQQNSTWEGEVEVLGNENAHFPVWQRVDTVRDAQNNILFYFVLMHDISERQRMWDTLRKQWEEHQMIFNHVPAMIWYRDHDNQLLRANKRAVEVFGPINELDEQAAVWHYTDCEEIIQLGRAQYGVLQQYQTKEGKLGWMQVDKIPYHDTHGNIMGVIVFASDITEYKHNQASLQASEERMYMAVENLPALLIALDSEGNILLWNRTCEQVSGYKVEEIVNNNRALELLYPNPDDRRRMVTQWSASVEPEVQWETRMTCKNGSLRTIAWRSVAKQFPIPGWHAWHIGQDITEHKQSTENSRHNTELLASVLASSKLGVCITDDRGRFVQVNNAYAELYGFRPEELVGQPFTTVLPPKSHNDAVREYYSLLMSHDEPTLVIQPAQRHAAGEVFNVKVISSRVILEDRRRMLISVVSKAVPLEALDLKG